MRDRSSRGTLTHIHRLPMGDPTSIFLRTRGPPLTGGVGTSEPVTKTPGPRLKERPNGR